MSPPGFRHPSFFLRLLLGASILLTALAAARVDFALMRDIAADRYGADAAELVTRWQREIDTMKTLPDQEKLERANHFFNSRIRWVPDPKIWDQADYWATPLEVLGRGMGDCEDFAIAKYTMLVLAGVDIDRLRITYVKARLDGTGGVRSQPHMVLAYYPSVTGEPVVLDNIVQDIHRASERTDLTPVYGFNSNGLWVGGATQPASRQPEARLSRWRELLQRAAQEGLG